MSNKIISVVIPAFNESNTILSVLAELEGYMQNYQKSDDWEIIVVNDGSTDRTIEMLNSIEQEKKWLRVIDLFSHYGRGKALRTGFEHAVGDIIISLDADLSYAPYHIEKLIRKMEEEDADIVLASAYGKGGTVKNVPPKRLWISKIGNKILSYMFGENITVLTCVVRAYKREFIDRLDLHSNDKEIHLEILYKARILGGKIVEIPADLCWRVEKLSKIHSKDQPKRRSTIKVKKTSSSHLFFALMNRPGLIFWIPGYVLISISLFVFLITFQNVLVDFSNGTSFYIAARNSMLTASRSWLTMAISFLLGIQFITIGFLTAQNKSNYEETYKTLNAIFTETKKSKK